MPDVYRVDEIDEGALAIWMEDVTHDTGRWTLDDYRRAGRLLGRMAGRHCAPSPPAGVPVVARDLRGYVYGRVRRGVLPVLADDAVWSHPLVAVSAAPQLRADLAALDAAADTLLDRLDTLPHALAHRDAAPQNLLRSTDRDELVAIDWQFVGMCAIGFDVGQVLAGHAESGDLEPTQLAPTLSAIVDAYTAGAHAEGAGIPRRRPRRRAGHAGDPLGVHGTAGGAARLRPDAGPRAAVRTPRRLRGLPH